jgi:hypothetical protein
MTGVNNKTLFPAELNLPPSNSVLFFSLFYGTLTLGTSRVKVAKGDFQPLWLKGLTWGKHNDGGIASFGLQQQPQARDNPVISERKGSVQVSPKVKSAIPKLGSRTGLVNICKVILAQ